VRTTPPSDDEAVLAKRARVTRLVSAGKRLGYSLFLVAIVAFAIGFTTGFGTGLVNVIVWSMVVGSLVLAPAIVFDYAVKAAVRDDREHGRSLD
jgi:hypothetical protein